MIETISRNYETAAIFVAAYWHEAGNFFARVVDIAMETGVTRWDLASLALIASSLWSVICRVNHLKAGKTKGIVFIQHLLLALGMFGGLILPMPYAKFSMACGVSFFLILGAGRWRYGAPADVTRPAPLDEDHSADQPRSK